MALNLPAWVSTCPAGPLNESMYAVCVPQGDSRADVVRQECARHRYTSHGKR